jgi:hypothetical protein
MYKELVSSYAFVFASIGLIIGVGVFTQNPMAVGVAMTMIAIAVYMANLVEGPELPLNIDLSALPSAVQGIFGTTTASSPATLQEVFYISQDQYTYDEAPAVCAVYNAELATYDQVADAFSKGAEWCGYGWTMGGMALFPTQEATWNKLQQERDSEKRTRCGRPGVNGGYFDPNTKFGVNCYGTKPGCNNRKYPIPLDVSVDGEKLKSLRVNSGAIKVSPFNRSGWSQWGF